VKQSFTVTLALVLTIVIVFWAQADLKASPRAQTPITSYVYYTLKQSDGFVLARAPRGDRGQPLSAPQVVAHFSNGFGLEESDSVLSMELSPDGRYLAIDGARDHGEQVWVYDTQHMTIQFVPAYVMGSFLNWLPGPTSHTFLYRPMFPLGPSAPMDGSGWNPGLWEVDAATGAHQNIDIHVPSAYLVDAAASPDGRHIVYSTSAGSGMGSDTWLMDIGAGSGPQQWSHYTGASVTQISHLFRTPAGAQSIAGLFAWSPDGKTIAYERLSDSPVPFLNAGLWIMDSHGGNQRHLASTDGGHGYTLAWSPDGKKIAFVIRTNLQDHLADINPQSLQTAIAVADPATSRSWIVASSVQTGMQINIHPQWTADSTSITFIAMNAVNKVLGGTPGYWSALVGGPAENPSVSPLTPVMSHVAAVG